MKKYIEMVSAAIYIVLALALLLPHSVQSAQLFYTVQVSSFSKMSDAEKQYETVMNKLDESQRDHLRIEKIGKFYSVRVGKFMDKQSGESFFSSVKAKLSGARLMDAYIKKERIVKMYASTAPELPATPIETVPSPPPAEQIVKPEPPVKTVKKAEPKPPAKTVKTIKAISLEESLKNIELLVKQENYNAALSVTRGAIDDHGDHPELNAWHGMVLLKQDEAQEALPYLEKAVNLSPEVPDFHNSLAYAYVYLERYIEAIEEFNKVLKYEKNHLDALTGLSISYAKNNNTFQAKLYYDMVKKIDRQTSQQILELIEKP